MNFTKPQYTSIISENELKDALEFYMKSKYDQDISIKHIKHNVGCRTEGHGFFEMDTPYQEGLTLTIEDK